MIQKPIRLGSSLGLPVKTNESGQRRCISWIESFLEYTEDQEAPAIWRQWTGIATLAAALQRKVWVRTTKGDLLPNLYTMLVGTPGTGKSVTIAAAEVLLRDVTGVHVAPTSMTMASMVDCLAEAKCSLVRPGQVPPLVEFNSLTILADELAALIHQYDHEFMAGLTKIYDGGLYAQYRRGKDLRIKIEFPQINLLAGTTPYNLSTFMPEGAWEQGFASRIIMVYSGERRLSDIFDTDRTNLADSPLYNDLLHDLQSIHATYGPLTMTDPAKAAFRKWREDGEKPTPKHPKLTHYCSRRFSHLIKLCMIASVSRGTDMTITMADLDLAKNWLLGAELSMPDIFTSGITGGDSKAMDEGYYFVWANFAKTKTPVPEHQLIHFMRERVPSHAVLRTIEIMERDGSITGKVNIRTGQKEYTPLAKKLDL